MNEGNAEGWAFPANSRKAHYIVDTFALCRRYGFYTRDNLEPDNGPSSDDCKECRRRLIALNLTAPPISRGAAGDTEGERAL